MWKKIKNWIVDLVKGRDMFEDIEKMPTNHEVQVAMANVVLRDIIKERRHERAWKLLKRTAAGAMFGIGFFYFVVFQASIHGYRIIPDDPLVGVVRIDGDIMSTTLASSEKIMPALRRAFEAESVKAVILAIDSPGGAPVEAERINYLLDELKAKHKKPVYAVIQNVGASAAYMIALHTDKIYAGRYSMVGSIGAVLSTWDVHKALAKYEVYQKVFASGELKAMLNPFVPSTKAAEDKAQAIVNVMGHRFNNELQERRGKLLQTNVKYDTGEIWDGEAAKKLGLIDEIGTIEAVVKEYPGTKLYEFGPHNPNAGVFSASVGQWVQSIMAGAIRSAMTVEPAVR
jgi:protease-4